MSSRTQSPSHKDDRVISEIDHARYAWSLWPLISAGYPQISNFVYTVFSKFYDVNSIIFNFWKRKSARKNGFKPSNNLVKNARGSFESIATTLRSHPWYASCHNTPWICAWEKLRWSKEKDRGLDTASRNEIGSGPGDENNLRIFADFANKL